MNGEKRTKRTEKVVNEFYCKNCDYKTYRKDVYNRHILTAKHLKVAKQIENDNDFLKNLILENMKITASLVENQNRQQILTNTISNNNINSNLPPVQFLGWKAAGTQIWARLKMACVDVKIEFSWDLSSVLMKIKCPQDRLEIVAEQMGMRMKNRNGSIRKFKCSKRDMFRYNSDGTGPFFKSSEKQQIIEYLLCCKIRDGGAGLDEDTELGKFIQQRFPLHKSNELNNLCRKWVTFWRIDNLYSKYLNKKYDFNICTICCMTITFIIKLIYVYMNHYITHVLHQPLHEVAGYFGENIAFYFAFLEFYTRWLIIPSVAGLIVFYFQVCTLLLLLLLL